MSNQDRLLSNAALTQRIAGIFYKDKKSLNYTQIARVKEAVDLINTQKRLYAEGVIGEDDVWEENEDGILEGIELERVWAKNKLRVEQRARIK